jgi:hypothetical protein
LSFAKLRRTGKERVSGFSVGAVSGTGLTLAHGVNGVAELTTTEEL